MKNSYRLFFSIVLLVVLQAQQPPVLLACSESYIAPVFDYKHAPENPYANFAAGRIGIVKPTYRRVVLYAAYRYLNNQAFSTDEQNALVAVWNAEFRNEEPPANDVTETVKAWLEARQIVASDEKTLPEIYIERQYGGYAFFPNCAANAFETATEILRNRAASYSADSRDVREWLRGQDAVFANCASGRSIPSELNESAAGWLRRDRAYQIAAAKFYSLDFEDARRRFAAIGEDDDSDWRETAEYLVGRTLVRQASFTKDEAARKQFYDEAERHLTSRGGGAKFSEASQKLVNLIKLRIRPEERVRELARNLTAQQSGEDLRQDLIDYTWMLDEIEANVLTTEEKRKEEVKKNEESKTENAAAETDANPVVLTPETYWTEQYNKRQSGEVIIFWIVSDEKNKPEDGTPDSRDSVNREFRFDAATPDAEIYKEVAEKLGRDLTDSDRDTIRQAREQGYQNKTTNRQVTDYAADYNGEELINLDVLPAFLRDDELTDWLFAFQIQDDEAFHYSLEKWRRTRSDLWLTTALSKAGKNSSDIADLMKAAEKLDRGAPAFPTVAYHAARIYIEQNKQVEAAKLLDSVLESEMDLPTSTRNQFAALRLKVAGTLDDFLRNATREPFTFADYQNSTTIDEAIERQKAWWNADYNKQSKADWDKETEEEFAGYKLWEHRRMFDAKTADVMNEHFPVSILLEAQKSERLPRYLRERLAVVVWTRAAMLGDDASLEKIAPEVLKFAPAEIEAYMKAKTAAAKRFGALYVVFRHNDFTPYIDNGYESGYGARDRSDDWWCALPEIYYDDAGSEQPRASLKRPGFLTAAQTSAAQAELKKVRAAGNASDFLSARAFEWLKLAPTDKRLPSVLYAAYKASEELRDGCGNGELRAKLANAILNRFPKSEEAAEIAAENK